MKKIEEFLNAFVIIILCGVLLSAYGVQFLYKEMPCPLCMLQRLGMLVVASGLALNLLFGVSPSHYALSLFGSLMGGFVALRQITLHICPGFEQFGFPVLGLSLYTWSFIVFVCSVTAISFLLFLYNPVEDKKPQTLDWFSKLAIGLLVFLTTANIITTFMQCGFGPCVEI